MNRRGFVAAVSAVLIAIGTIGAAAPAAAAPPTDPWDGSAGGSVATLTTDAVGLQLADLGVAVSAAEAGSTLTPRASSVSSNVSADVLGLGIAVESNSQTAPPDAGGPVGGNLLAVSVPTLLDIGALTTTNEAHWDVDTACVTDGLLAAATTETAGLSLLPLLADGVLELGVSQTQGETGLVQNSGLNYGVESVATGSITGLSLIGGAITVDVEGDTTLTATATGTSAGTVVYDPGTVTVNTPTGPVVLTVADPTVTVSIPLIADVTISLNSPSITTSATSASATSSLLTVDISVLGVFPLPPVAEVSVDVLPLSASATAPSGGIDCPPAPPVITDPTEGETTGVSPTISGTADANASVEVFIDGSSIGTTSADGLGVWSLPVPTPLAGGPHVATAVQTVGGTASAVSAPVNFIVDATAPAPPVIVSPADGSLLSDDTPPISGTAEADATVEVFVDGTSIGNTVANGLGEWSLTPATPLTDGSHTAIATATDAAGNDSGDSNEVTFTIDATAPAPPVITTPGNGDVTDDPTPLIEGTSEGDALITVYIDGVEAGTTTASGTGDWTFIPTTPLADGPHTVLATATDAATNVSADSDEVAFTVDTTAPVAPVITTPADGSVTNDTTPDIAGTAEPDTTVEVFIDGTSVGTAPVDGLGDWTLILTTPLTEGPHTAVANATDAAGNTGPDSAEVDFTIDITAPVAPVITSPEDGSTVDTATPPIVGTAEPNSTVEVFIDGVSIGTTPADGLGDWSLTPSAPLAEGPHEATATATDATGGTGAESEPVAFTVDTAAPAAPVITSPTDGALLNDSTPTFAGTAEAGATVEVFVDGTSIGTTTAVGGAWNLTPGSPLAEGPHTVVATATDAGGNVSPDSNTVAFSIDSVDPAAPVITSPEQDEVIDDPTPAITGTAEPNATVNIIIDGVTVGTAPVDGSGAWTFTPATPLDDGPHTVTATATDAAGNVGPAAAPVDFVVDTTAPAAPVITSPADGSTTNDPTPSISGTAEPGSTVEVFVDGTSIGTTTASDTGAWSLTPPAPLADGDHTATATATDALDRVSPPSAEVGFTIDTTPPAAPVITSPADGSSTTDPTPPITGTAEPGSEVTVIVDGTAIGSTTADENGDWTFTPTSPLPNGEHEITAEATDGAGNTGPESEPVTVTIAQPATGEGELPATGGVVPVAAALVGGLLLALGAGLITARRRRA